MHIKVRYVHAHSTHMHSLISWSRSILHSIYLFQTHLKYHSTSDYIRKLLVKRMMGWRRFLHRGGYRFSRDFRADIVNRWPLKEDIALSHPKPALPQNLQVNLWVGGGECEYCQSILTSVGLEGESLRNSARLDKVAGSVERFKKKKVLGHSGVWKIRVVSDFDVGNPFILPCFGAVCFAVRSSSPLRRSCAEDSSAGRRCGPQHDEFLAMPGHTAARWSTTRPPHDSEHENKKCTVWGGTSPFQILPNFPSLVTRIHQGCLLGPRKVMVSDALGTWEGLTGRTHRRTSRNLLTPWSVSVRWIALGTAGQWFCWLVGLVLRLCCEDRNDAGKKKHMYLPSICCRKNARHSTSVCSCWVFNAMHPPQL